MENQKITPHLFFQYEKENSRSVHNEWMDSVDPKFEKYQIQSQNFISMDVYSTYRVTESTEQLISEYEDRQATPITLSALAKNEKLIQSLLDQGFISNNDTVIAYHCECCNVRVVKDGIHRLLTWAVRGENKLITVYQVSSSDWSSAKVDMPNFCKCKK